MTQILGRNTSNAASRRRNYEIFERDGYVFDPYGGAWVPSRSPRGVYLIAQRAVLNMQRAAAHRWVTQSQTQSSRRKRPASSPSNARGSGGSSPKRR